MRDAYICDPPSYLKPCTPEVRAACVFAQCRARRLKLENVRPAPKPNPDTCPEFYPGKER